MNGLTELEELVLSCQDHQTRQYVRDAVACYGVGVYRQAVVASWIAVAYGFLHKVRLLAAAGRGDAVDLLKDYEVIKNETDPDKKKQGLQGFENSILGKSFSPFEFINEQEKRELERLYADRHLCAHPTMNSVDEPFEPSAELARYHIRNSVRMFLSQPPTQGKWAEESFFDLVGANEFPVDSVKAEDLLRNGYIIPKAREGLVKSIMQKIGGALLSHDQPADKAARLFAACNAMLAIHSEVAERHLGEKLTRISAEVSPEHFHRVIAFVGNVPRSWPMLGRAGIIRAHQCIETAEAGPGLASLCDDAHQCGELRGTVAGRIASLSSDELVNTVEPSVRKDLFVERALELFDESRAYTDSRSLGRQAIVPCARFMDAQQAKRVLRSFARNGQIYDCHWGMPSIMISFLAQTTEMADDLVDDWKEVSKRANSPGISRHYQGFLTELRRRLPGLRPEGWIDPLLIDYDELP